jgi:DNA-binding winged helix-turn-helix (wHTH) protein/TolB-like protein
MTMPTGEMRPKETGRFRFGVFEFDAEKLELSRRGSLIPLQTQPSRILACLVENAGQVVTRQQLSAALWGEETFVDFDRGLNFSVSQLRSALADDSARPIYIQTFPKRGYQFIAPVERMALPAEVQRDTSAGSPRKAGLQRAVLAGYAVVALAIIGCGVAYWLWHRHAEQRIPPIIAVLRFDNETGNSDLTRVSDALTDDVVEQLTERSDGRYAVIGNSDLLRVAREQRNLSSIGKSLHARYVVLGQLQSNGSQVRILAHLIRMPAQTHVTVTRTEQTLGDPLALELETAQGIADKFSVRVKAETLGTPQSAPPNH